MPTYTAATAAALAKSAGLPTDKATIAGAIAIAESSGNSSAHTLDSDDDSYGLWQINMLGAMGPARRALYGLKSNSDLLDPATNARVMSAISKQGQDFGPWTTYTSGKYKQYLPSGSAVGKALTGGLLGIGGDAIVDGPIDTAKSVIDLASRASDALTKTGNWVSNPSNWVRVAYVTIGAVAVIAGISAVIRSTEAGQTAIQTTQKAAAVGAKIAAA